MIKKLTLRQIEVFVSAAKLGSFGDAAEGLGITQPALSQAVRDLELDYGTQLFDRSTRPVTLTPVGRQFLPAAERVVNAYQAARQEIEELSSGKIGRVSIAALQSFATGFLPTALTSFAEVYPGIVIDVIEQPAEKVAQLVRTGVVDFGVANVVSFVPDLETRFLLQDSYIAICREDHPLAAKTAVNWRELAGYPLVAMSQTTGIWREMESTIIKTGAPYRVNYWASSAPIILGMIKAGIGIAALPSLTFPPSGYPELVHRPMVEPVLDRKLHIIFRRGEAPSPAAQHIAAHFEHCAAKIPLP